MDRLLELFAGIFDTAGVDLARRVQECAKCATAVGVPSGDLDEFARFVDDTPAERIVELYRESSPCIGRQLYGEGYGRSMLLLDLQKRYRRQGFETGDEPLDHLSVLLRFLSECDDPAEREELAREVLVPGLQAMIASSGSEGSTSAPPFVPLLRALSAAVREQVGS
jgi:nitrate reductase assembly molybdenum cofactor insertion protein NarJ